jgi:hypothetical protein
MFVKPPGPRHQVLEQADGIAIRIPTRRNLFILVFLSLWLCGWAVGEVSAPIAFFASARKNPGTDAFLLIWLCGWTVGGAFAICVWLWQFKGCEIITVSPVGLGIRHEVIGFGLTRSYELSEIRDLRIAPPVFNPFDFRSRMSIWGIGGGTIAFDYGYKTFRFAAGVDEAEARIIFQKITDASPALRKKADINSTLSS